MTFGLEYVEFFFLERSFALSFLCQFSLAPDLLLVFFYSSKVSEARMIRMESGRYESTDESIEIVIF